MLSKSLLKLLAIFVWVAMCKGGKCWWQAQFFHENHTRNDAHLMWSRSRTSNQSLHFQFFCRKSEGHDVVLCAQPIFTGECYASHIPKGQNCTNVDPEINDLAASVHTLGQCIRVYDEANCQGKWKVFKKGTFGFDKLLEMNKMVTSVGLCIKEDRPGGCSQATRKGRLQCSFLTDGTVTSAKEIQNSLNDKKPARESSEYGRLYIVHMMNKLAPEKEDKNQSNLSNDLVRYRGWYSVNRTNTSAEEIRNSFNDKKPARKSLEDQASHFDHMSGFAGVEEIRKQLNLSNYWESRGSSLMNEDMIQNIRNSSMTSFGSISHNYRPYGRRRTSLPWPLNAILLLLGIASIIFMCIRCCLSCFFKKVLAKPECKPGNARVTSNRPYSFPHTAMPGVFVVDEKGTVYK